MNSGGLCRWPPPDPKTNKRIIYIDGVCFCFICAQSGLCGTSSIMVERSKEHILYHLPRRKKRCIPQVALIPNLMRCTHNLLCNSRSSAVSNALLLNVSLLSRF